MTVSFGNYETNNPFYQMTGKGTWFVGESGGFAKTLIGHIPSGYDVFDSAWSTSDSSRISIDEDTGDFTVTASASEVVRVTITYLEQRRKEVAGGGYDYLNVSGTATLFTYDDVTVTPRVAYLTSFSRVMFAGEEQDITPVDVGLTTQYLLRWPWMGSEGASPSTASALSLPAPNTLRALEGATVNHYFDSRLRGLGVTLRSYGPGNQATEIDLVVLEEAWVEPMVLVTGRDGYEVGDTSVFTARTFRGSDSGYAWTSSNPSVGEIDEGGEFTALASGTTTITATGNDTGESEVMVVRVFAPGTPYVYFVYENPPVLKSKYIYENGGSLQIVTVNATDSGYTLASDNSNVMYLVKSITWFFNVRYIGTATLSAEGLDSGLYHEITVTSAWSEHYTYGLVKITGPTHIVNGTTATFTAETIGGTDTSYTWSVNRSENFEIVSATGNQAEIRCIKCHLATDITGDGSISSSYSLPRVEISVVGNDTGYTNKGTWRDISRQSYDGGYPAETYSRMAPDSYVQIEGPYQVVSSAIRDGIPLTLSTVGASDTDYTVGPQNVGNTAYINETGVLQAFGNQSCAVGCFEVIIEPHYPLTKTCLCDTTGIYSNSIYYGLGIVRAGGSSVLNTYAPVIRRYDWVKIKGVNRLMQGEGAKFTAETVSPDLTDTEYEWSVEWSYASYWLQEPSNSDDTFTIEPVPGEPASVIIRSNLITWQTTPSPYGPYRGYFAVRAVGLNSGVDGYFELGSYRDLYVVIDISGANAVKVGANITLLASTTLVSDPSYEWSATGAGSISPTGVLTGNTPGTAEVEVVGDDTYSQSSTSIRVYADGDELIVVSGRRVMEVGDGSAFTATKIGTAESISWSSSNESVATVSAGGGVSAVAAGSTNIVATGDDSGITSTIALNVYEQETYGVVRLRGFWNGVLHIDSETAIAETVNAIDHSYNWSLDGGADVADIDPSTGVITTHVLTAYPYFSGGTIRLRYQGADSGIWSGSTADRWELQDTDFWVYPDEIMLTACNALHVGETKSIVPRWVSGRPDTFTWHTSYGTRLSFSGNTMTGLTVGIEFVWAASDSYPDRAVSLGLAVNILEDVGAAIQPSNSTGTYYLRLSSAWESGDVLVGTCITWSAESCYDDLKFSWSASPSTVASFCHDTNIMQIRKPGTVTATATGKQSGQSGSFTFYVLTHDAPLPPDPNDIYGTCSQSWICGQTAMHLDLPGVEMPGEYEAKRLTVGTDCATVPFDWDYEVASTSINYPVDIIKQDAMGNDANIHGRSEVLWARWSGPYIHRQTLMKSYMSPNHLVAACMTPRKMNTLYMRLVDATRCLRCRDLTLPSISVIGETDSAGTVKAKLEEWYDLFNTMADGGCYDISGVGFSWSCTGDEIPWEPFQTLNEALGAMEKEGCPDYCLAYTPQLQMSVSGITLRPNIGYVPPFPPFIPDAYWVGWFTNPGCVQSDPVTASAALSRTWAMDYYNPCWWQTNEPYGYKWGSKNLTTGECNLVPGNLLLWYRIGSPVSEVGIGWDVGLCDLASLYYNDETSSLGPYDCCDYDFRAHPVTIEPNMADDPPGDWGATFNGYMWVCAGPDYMYRYGTGGTIIVSEA